MRRAVQDTVPFNPLSQAHVVGAVRRDQLPTLGGVAVCTTLACCKPLSTTIHCGARGQERVASHHDRLAILFVAPTIEPCPALETLTASPPRALALSLLKPINFACGGDTPYPHPWPCPRSGAFFLWGKVAPTLPFLVFCRGWSLRGHCFEQHYTSGRNGWRIVGPWGISLLAILQAFWLSLITRAITVSPSGADLISYNADSSRIVQIFPGSVGWGTFCVRPDSIGVIIGVVARLDRAIQ
jgi:hypothetical protein